MEAISLFNIFSAVALMAPILQLCLLYCFQTLFQSAQTFMIIFNFIYNYVHGFTFVFCTLHLLFNTPPCLQGVLTFLLKAAVIVGSGVTEPDGTSLVELGSQQQCLLPEIMTC